MQEIFDAPEWFEALTLGERAALLAAGEDGDPASAAQAGRAAPTPAGGVDSPDLAGRARAAQKLARWRREAGLLSDDLFAERLAGQGLTPEELLCILAEPAGGLRRRAGGRPDWLQRLADCFSRPASPLPPGSAADGLELGLLELFRPLVAEARARLLGGLRSISSARPSPAVCDPEAIVVGLLGVLLDRLREAAERTLVLELHACRLEGRLSGETPEERFSSFVGLLRDRAAGLEILRRYPVLARDACRCADQWVEAGLEMMRRLAADRGEIAGCLAAGSDPGPAVAARAGLGDPHGGGRSVAVLTFASGLRIVYKPRSLAIEARFQQLIGELNRRGLAPPLRPLAVVDRGSHGWMEHVAAAPCRTADEVERFHERQGVWLALLYAFEATDCHWENLVAAGEHPVPIDLETLFQGIVEEPSDPGAGWVPSDHTVLRGGLLPRRFWAEGDHGGLDLSGMGAAAGQAVEIGRMVGAGTDRIRWAREREQIGAGPHLPTLRGEPVSLWQHREAVLRGFRSTWHLVRRHRGELEGWLAGCAELPVRALLRPTVAYAHLLHTARHPDYLRCALDRDRLHDRLWTTATAHPRLRRALRRESEDLAAGDVPRFLALAGSRDLLDPEGGRIAGFFARSGLELVRRRLGEMDGEELERQSWLVRAALEATRPLAEHRARGRETLPESGAAEPRSFLDAACRLGDRLSRLALERAGRVTWFHLEVGDDGWRLAPMPVNLYSGLLGAALFFAHLARFSPDGERHERLARLALGTARRRLAADRGEVRGLGAFSGWGGVVYGLTHLGLLWQEPALLDEAEGWAARMGPLIASDEVFDLIGGSAGAAAALLALGRHRPSAARLELAVACGDRLLAGAVPGERGLGWPAPRGVSRRPLTGFGHGTAGIAWALARLAGAAREDRFRRAAQEALRYERSWFSPERRSWPDLRESRETSEGPAFLHAWCHGAAGIGLGRIGSLADLDDPEMRSEIRAAAAVTLAEGFGFNHSLCHGDLGNLELVREAGRVLGDGDLTAEAGRLAARILAQIETRGPRCGAGAETEAPGLLTGLAGIGYGLLRAASPQRVPSVLLLETPA